MIIVKVLASNSLVYVHNRNYSHVLCQWHSDVMFMVKKMVLVKIMVNGHGHGNGYNQDIGMAKIMVTVRIIVKILLIIIVMGRIIKLVNGHFLDDFC